MMKPYAIRFLPTYRHSSAREWIRFYENDEQARSDVERLVAFETLGQGTVTEVRALSVDEAEGRGIIR